MGLRIIHRYTCDLCGEVKDHECSSSMEHRHQHGQGLVVPDGWGFVMTSEPDTLAKMLSVARTPAGEEPRFPWPIREQIICSKHQIQALTPEKPLTSDSPGL